MNIKESWFWNTQATEVNRTMIISKLFGRNFSHIFSLIRLYCHIVISVYPSAVILKMSYRCSDIGYFRCIGYTGHPYSEKVTFHPTSHRSTSVPGPSRWDGDEDPGKIHFIVPKFWGKNRMRSATQPYWNTVEYGCVSLRMRFFSKNFGTIKRILPGSSSSSHREGPGIEVGHRIGLLMLKSAYCLDWKMSVRREHKFKTLTGWTRLSSWCS